MAMDNPSGLADFLGTWSLCRVVRDALTGGTAHLDGTVSITPKGQGAVWQEVGQLHLPGMPPMEARRTYLWSEVAPGEITVSFDNGSPFHRILLRAPFASDSHHCAPDHYKAAYAFADWPKWSVTWHVKGPRKDYVSESTLVPAGFAPLAEDQRVGHSGEEHE